MGTHKEDLELIGFKHCTNCGACKPISEFRIVKTRGSLRCECKECERKKIREHHRKTYEERKDYNSKYLKQWRKDHPRYDHDRRMKNPDKVRSYDRLYSQTPMRAYKTKVRQQSRNLVLNGLIIHPGCCEICGITADEEKIHIHHCSYNVPDDVLFLCTSCHNDWHRKNPAPPEPTEEWVTEWYQNYKRYPEEEEYDYLD